MQIATMPEVTFKVRVEAKRGDSVFLVGDALELGSWKPQAAVPLNIVENFSSSDGQLWTKAVDLSADNVKYRFFTGYCQTPPGGSKGFIVTSWETNLAPRTWKSSESSDEESFYGAYGGSSSISKGWLDGQTEVQLRFHGNPISMLKQSHKELSYRIKCSAYDMEGEAGDNSENNVDSTEKIPVLVSVLDGDNNEPAAQPPCGVLVENDNYVLFRAQTFAPQQTAFQFTLYAYDERASVQADHKRIGSAYYVPLNTDQALGTAIVSITDISGRLIGNLTVEYLVIKPMPDHPCDMSVSYSRYWNNSTPSLDIGHRGMGNSHSGIRAPITENSLASLNGAGKNGADYVEFDVQLTSDNVPVIYHDFMACSSLQKKLVGDSEYYPLQVTDLTYSQLQHLKLDHLSVQVKDTKHQETESQDESFDTRPFPTLKQCFELVEPYIGFNVEIKYPQKMKDGSMEDGVKRFPDRNDYLDIILKEVLECAGNRRIVYSCFDADVCTMIQLKQNKYPVVFLSSGPVCGYDPYFDRRTWDVPSAINFAVSEQLLGINPNGNDLLHEPKLVSMARKRNLIVFCWGKVNNEKSNVKLLKEMGVQGVISDRVYELVEEGKMNIFKGSS